MRQDKFSKAYLTLYACGVIPVVWLALLPRWTIRFTLYGVRTA